MTLMPKLLIQPLGRIIMALALAIISLTLAIGLLGQGTAQARPPVRPAAAVGDILTRIECVSGYTATIYAENLSSPDGLAFSPDGILYVAEEGTGQITKIGSDGMTTTILTGLSNPEGIAFDDNGTLYVVEDITGTAIGKGGRLVTRATNGTTSTLVTGLEAPEGVVWVDDGSADGILYVTESKIEYALSIRSTDPNDYQTYVTSISLLGDKTRILTTTGLVNVVGFPVPTLVTGTFWSYAGIDIGPDGNLYVTNELSGKEVSDTVSIPPFSIPFEANSTDSVFTTPTTLNLSGHNPFANNQLVAPEGLRFSADGGFPLYVTEESTSTTFPDPDGRGRLSKVESDGSHSPFCTGFYTLEDVAVDKNGWLYVSEDKSPGYVILIKPDTPSFAISKTVDDDTVTSDQRITYTVIVTNVGNTAIGAVISDTLPDGLTFAGPVTLEGTSGTVAQSGADLPTLAGGLTITGGLRITITYPVTVTNSLSDGQVITNTAAVTSTEVLTATSSAVKITVSASSQPIYLPVILKNTTG